MVLTGEAETAARGATANKWPEGKGTRELREQVGEDLARAVSEIYLFWQAKHGAGTVPRRRQGRPQRPARCGSGKKYKQCCGKAD